MGNSVGCAFDKLEEGFTWLISLISQRIKAAFYTIKEACAWLISTIIALFKMISEWTENGLNQTRPFFDNFSEKFKESLIKSKNTIDRTMEKAATITSAIAQWLHLSSQKLKLKLENLATSLVENLKELFGNVMEYMALVSKAEKKIGRRYKMLAPIDNILFNLYRMFRGNWVEIVRDILDGFLQEKL